MSPRARSRSLDTDPLWYKDAIIYEVHVRAFHDSNGDGIGDFRGLTQKLDYLQQLGVTAIWVLPFYPSPLRDDGYDIADYHAVHPPYGNMRDFKEFLRAAHERGLRVITELIINHTSDQHPWFQRARRAKPGSRYRDYYVWSDTTERYKEARIIFQDFERSNWTFDPEAGAYYWHRFYSHQPDLNFDNPAVCKAVTEVMDYWFELGVDGMRLDAIPYLFERDGTDCENLPETHVFLRQLRQHLDRTYPGRMLLAEANQWPEDAAAYFGEGDECHMNFHFPLMPRLFMALHMEDRHPIIDILEQTPAIPETNQWALFLRNHDELTLEMVTDEERDYMYRVYASERRARINLGIRRRLAPLLKNNRRRIELMNALLMSLPGTPVLYYGDEIGMGDNVHLGDRDGVRTPMQWSADRNAGFSRANPQSLFLPVIIDPEFHCDAVNVEAQLQNPQSLLWWMKRIIALRREHRAFGRGAIRFLFPSNRKILAFVRSHEDETILVVANLSRFVQAVHLDLGDHVNQVPVELFGRSELPPIGHEPYFLTLGPHAFFWFDLQHRDPATDRVERRLPELRVSEQSTQLLEGKSMQLFERALVPFLRAQRWFGSKTHEIDRTEIVDLLDVPGAEPRVAVVLVLVFYTDAEPELYQVPLAYAAGHRAEELEQTSPQCIVARLTIDDTEQRGLLYDAGGVEPGFASALLDAIRYRRRLKGRHSFADTTRTSLLGPAQLEQAPPHVRILRAEQSNSSAIFGDRFILKLFRRIEPGAHPDIEVPLHLARRRFDHAPRVAGYLTHHGTDNEPVVLGVVHTFVPNAGDAWQLALDMVGQMLERVTVTGGQLEPSAPGAEKDPAPDRRSQDSMVQFMERSEGPFLESMQLLGRRTAELHLALAADSETPAFKPENFTPFYRRSLYQSLRNLNGEVVQMLEKRQRQVPAAARSDAAEVIGVHLHLNRWLKSTLDGPIRAVRIRTHGDLHLGQVLYTGPDFVFIDFEGEPARSLDQRRLKRCPLRDVAGMLRSFHYAALSGLPPQDGELHTEEAEADLRRGWVLAWYEATRRRYLDGYLERSRDSSLYQALSEGEIDVLLKVFQLEKALYEVRYELNNRPDWVWIPLAGLTQLLGELQLLA